MSAMSEIGSLPQYAQDYTPEQVEACISYLASLGVPELRHRQALWNQQIVMAWDQGKNDRLVEDMNLKAEQIRQAIVRAAGL